MSIPQSFLCPITQEKMVNPVSDENGHTFEKNAIEAWLKKHQTSPITNLPYKSYNLVPNRSLRDAIEEFKAKDMDENKAKDKNKPNESSKNNQSKDSKLDNLSKKVRESGLSEEEENKKKEEEKISMCAESEPGNE